MELYHYCPVPLENGSVITPGNWGRIIRQYPMPDNCNAIVVKELLLENIRLRLYPSYPSRLDCAYVCIGEESAKEFKSRRELHFCYHLKCHLDPLRIGTVLQKNTGLQTGSLSLPTRLSY